MEDYNKKLCKLLGIDTSINLFNPNNYNKLRDIDLEAKAGLDILNRFYYSDFELNKIKEIIERLESQSYYKIYIKRIKKEAKLIDWEY